MKSYDEFLDFISINQEKEMVALIAQVTDQFTNHQLESLGLPVPALFKIIEINQRITINYIHWLLNQYHFWLFDQLDTNEMRP